MAVASYTEEWLFRGAGRVPAGASLDHDGDADPFAAVNIQVSARAFDASRPPKTVIRFVPESRMAVWPDSAGAAVPPGASAAHVGTPPKPLAFESTHTSFEDEAGPAPA